MSVATPTILPRPALFPRLLPKPPHPPVPLATQGKTRNLQREMDDLSDEENELDELNHVIRARGFANLVPMGRSLTQQEEKNDAEDDEESESDSDSAPSNRPPSVVEDHGDDTQDLDASMEDLDEQDDDEDSDGEEIDLNRSSEQ
ncbi:hypothetical protein FB45DRAFT_329788 [Roridomyces roridus]|uniref:Uncharacterized protein n=1 Tax=Roridomyces roridus TaxID=1738132 RepID=A0AAD7B5W9_9AGAR|nr:hypothetical protein FB45DRAFT_329788 [Roridomyces roridus]